MLPIPISRSRGAYWAGRAAEAGGDMHLAQTWFRRAFFHQTTFYGQLAAARLPGEEVRTAAAAPH